MNYIKYFLIFLISLWLVGFWYVFKTNSSSSSAAQNANDYKEEENGDSSSNKWLNRIKKAEQDLAELEEKNRKNEETIRGLR